MRPLKQEEFESIKSYIENKKPRNPAMFFLRTSKLMDRSVATIHRIDASKDYDAYKKLVKSEHTAKNPRVPLATQLHEAKVNELMIIKSRGRFGAYRAVCERLAELGI